MQFESPIANALNPVLHAICRDKEDYSLMEHQNGHTLRLGCLVSLDDYRILVGKQGRTIHAIQRIVKRAGERGQCDAEFTLRNNTKGLTIKVHQFVANSRFDEGTFATRLSAMCGVLELDISESKVGYDGGEKMVVTIPTTNMEDTATVKDLADLFFPYGYTLGRRIDIKPET